MIEYPTDEELKRIAAWPIQCSADIMTLLDLVKRLWNWPDRGWAECGNFLHLSTGGWSGNEELINALRDNFIFWSLCWQSVRRGGHYVFEVPEFPKKEEPHEQR